MTNVTKTVCTRSGRNGIAIIDFLCVCVSFSHPGFRLGRPSRRNAVLPFLWCLLCTTRWTWVILSMICLTVTDAVLTLLRHDGQLNGLTYFSSLQSRSRWAFRRSPSYITFWLRAEQHLRFSHHLTKSPWPIYSSAQVSSRSSPFSGFLENSMFWVVAPESHLQA